jgi:hypothetical protein
MMKHYGVNKASLVQTINMQINTVNQHELSIPELNYLSPLFCNSCCRIFLLKSSLDLKGAKIAIALVFLMTTVADELCAGTDWY